MRAQPQSSPPPDSPRSWRFWRKRIGRALIVGALAVTAAQILPTLPEDQILQINPPPGVKLSQAELTYFAKETATPLLGTQLMPVAPSPMLVHTARLPSDDYKVSIVATGADAAGSSRTFAETHTVSLTGSTARVFLKGSKPSP